MQHPKRRTIGIGDGEGVPEPRDGNDGEAHEDPVRLGDVDLALHDARRVHHFYAREAAQHERLADDGEGARDDGLPHAMKAPHQASRKIEPTALSNVGSNPASATAR